MNSRVRYRNLLLVGAGIVCLLLKPWFNRHFGDLAHSYLGNVSASFAVYFIIAISDLPGLTRTKTAGLALLVVEGFELTNGFGVMTNVYDPFDYLANAIGIGLAVCVDAASKTLE
jgi:hypothetical protein